MKQIIILLLTGLLGACGEPGPALHLAAGGSVDLADLRGKVVLINYWAEWCQPCREEIPELNAFALQQADKVAIYAVNFDGVTGEQLQQQAQALGIAFPLLGRDPRELFAVKPSGVLPETLVLDRQGQFKQVLLGPQTAQTLEAVVDRWFAEEK